MKRHFIAIKATWIAFFITICLGIILVAQAENKTLLDIIITIGFFLIVTLVFCYATSKYIKLYELINDIKKTTERINIDYSNSGNQLLWEKYRNSGRLFNSERLNSLYKTYLEDNERLSNYGDNGVYGDIEDYFNYKLIDSTTKKNVMNLIAGAMTGLGILGTFIGLSFGLRHFSTGSSEEISNSISPLMDGIKVAFHTSIYGMILSLLFNFGYKNDLEHAYDVLDEFLDTYKSKVLIKPESGVAQVMVQYQKKQTEDISELASLMSEKMAEKMSEFLLPQFDRMNNTINSFADLASRAQIDGIRVIAENFVNEMNKSLGNRFEQLAKVIDDTCMWQKRTAGEMEQILVKVGTMTSNIDHINTLSEVIVQKSAAYIEKVDALQTVVTNNMEQFNLRLKDYQDINVRQNEFVSTIVEYEKSMFEAMTAFSTDMARQVQTMEALEGKIQENAIKNMAMITAKAEESSDAIAEAASNQIDGIIMISNTVADNMDRAAEELSKASGQLGDKLNNVIVEALGNVTRKTEDCMTKISEVAQRQIDAIVETSNGLTSSMDNSTKELSMAASTLNNKMEQRVLETFEVFDKELSEIVQHLSATIADIREITRRVPRTVNEAYEGMKGGFKEMEASVKNMSDSMERLRRKMDAQFMTMDIE